MNLAQLQQDFLPKDLTLQLVRDLSPDQYEDKIALVQTYAASAAHHLDPDVLQIHLHEHIGFIYWDAGKFEEALLHYQKVLGILQPRHAPFLYFHVACMVVQCLRKVGNLVEAFAFAGKMLESTDQADSPFQTLTLLKEYVLVLESAQLPLDPQQLRRIEQVWSDLGFPVLKATDGISKVREMNELNQHWNRELALIHIHSKTPEAQQAALQAFADACPIRWYRDHVKNQFPDREFS